MDHARILGIYLAFIPEDDMEKLVELHRELRRANQHYGLSSQVQASSAIQKELQRVADNIPPYYVKEIEEKLSKVM